MSGILQAIKFFTMPIDAGAITRRLIGRHLMCACCIRIGRNNRITFERAVSVFGVEGAEEAAGRTTFLFDL